VKQLLRLSSGREAAELHSFKVSLFLTDLAVKAGVEFVEEGT
jgi:hypothetical protein